MHTIFYPFLLLNVVFLIIPFQLWQAFVGVRTRRMERYYQDLLALEGVSGEVEAVDESSAALKKWKKQIEKVFGHFSLGLPPFNLSNLLVQLLLPSMLMWIIL